MIRFTTYLALAACVAAAPAAVAQPPGQGPQDYPRPAGVSPGPRPPAESADRTPPAPAASAGRGSDRAVEVILRASGVPNHNGQVAWPVALRLLGADARLQQLEAQLQLAAEQAVAGGVNPELLSEVRLNVEELDRLLVAERARRLCTPLEVYDDAGRFLRTLQRAPQLLAASPPTGRPQATAHEGQGSSESYGQGSSGSYGQGSAGREGQRSAGGY
jgi:hypothetical protein